MPIAGRGLHEELLTEALEAEIATLGGHLVAERGPLRAAEAADRLGLHLARVIERAVETLPERERAARGAALARRLIDVLVDELGAGLRAEERGALRSERPIARAELLHAVLGRLPDARVETIPTPLIPLLDTTLLTNAPGEPLLAHQIRAEIGSSDRIDLLMAFIRRSGIGPLRDALKRHCDAGRALRVLTTTFTRTTDVHALDDLRAVGADVRVSYDESGRRHHAKAWLFHRRSGFDTAYVGSSNLTHAAQQSGLEWNVRVSRARNGPVIAKIAMVFESYWNGGDFVPFDHDEFVERTRPDAARTTLLMSPLEVRPEPFQERLLEQIALSREAGHHRNLLVSATGTGKTVMAAIDYARLRERLPRARLLFVAHREEILEQSRLTFGQVLRDRSFGERWVGGARPRHFEHVFASIQSLAKAGHEHLDPAHFDVVIVDEFHHAAASSYQALLDHVRPRELLGLTATPERADGLSILGWFGGRIAAELRLWDAIDQHRLVPFAYYGVSDGLDLRAVPWRRGRGYDVAGLSNLITGNDAWARLVLEQLRRRVDDLRTMRALGFCVSVEHARFMARIFAAAGLRAAAVWADTPDAERQRALADLRDGALQVVFSVDLFNEGVDVPAVDTLLLLRPTDSPTLFLQQLGRGLRRHHGKTVCTVLDFVGTHRQEFRFDRRLGALLGGTRRDVIAQVEQGFPFLPAGCHMELDAKASEQVLESIRKAVPEKWTAKVSELQRLVAAVPAPTLAEYLEAADLDVEDVYAGGRSWSDLRADVGLPLLPPGPHEAVLRRAVGRLLHVDDRERIDTYRRVLRPDAPHDPACMTERERRLLRMLVASLLDKAVDKGLSLAEGAALVRQHAQVCEELVELLDVLGGRLQHVTAPLAHPDEPLQVHARYTRREILAAFGVGEGAKVHSWQTGVQYVEAAAVDLLAFTLDKTSGQFSPTTRYRDHAISRELVHWESQSVVRADGNTGRRYQEHARRGSRVMLFARMRADDRAFYFLGPGSYVSHEGELPMAITWKLEHPLPGDLFAAFAAAVA